MTSIKNFSSLKQVRKFIYDNTHNDYKGKGNILIWRNGTCSTPITTLTLEELSSQMRYECKESEQEILEYLSKLK